MYQSVALKLSFSLAALCILSPVWACGQFEPCEGKHPAIKLKKLTVVQSSVLTDHAPEPQADCKQFQLSARQAREYLQRAGSISANAMHYVVSDSSCVATGTLVTTAGRKATWRIGVLREAQVRWPNGQVTYLYCSHCAAPPFAD